MSPPCIFHLYTCSQLLQCILANRLQEQQACFAPLLLGLLEQVLVDQRSHSIQHLSGLITERGGDGLSCLKCAATHENGEPPEETLLPGAQQIITPRDRIAQRLLAQREIARAPRQDLESVL